MELAWISCAREARFVGLCAAYANVRGRTFGNIIVPRKTEGGYPSLFVLHAEPRSTRLVCGAKLTTTYCFRLAARTLLPFFPNHGRDGGLSTLGRAQSCTSDASPATARNRFAPGFAGVDEKRFLSLRHYKGGGAVLDKFTALTGERRRDHACTHDKAGRIGDQSHGALTLAATAALPAFSPPYRTTEITCLCMMIEPGPAFDDTIFFRHWQPPPLPKSIHSRAARVKPPEILCEVPGDQTAVTDCGVTSGRRI